MESSLRQETVLIVDDEENIRLPVAMALEDEGYSVVMAEDGRQALEMARSSERLDLIVDKMLAKDPKLRFAACTEVVEELEGLGLANETLSFFEEAAPASPAPSVSGKRPASAAKTPADADAPVEPKADPNIWYWSFKDPRGHPVTKKVTNDELLTLIKTGSMDAKAQISKSIQGGYRAVASFVEFEPFFRGKIAEKKAGRGAQHYKHVLEEIEQQEARRQKMKWLKGLFAKFGSAVGLVVWLGVLTAVLVGGYFGVMWILARTR